MLETTIRHIQPKASEHEHSISVFKTVDYSIFSKLSGNRELNKNHVRRLTKVIATNPEFTKKSPIIVNQNMSIIDGQHRVAAFELVKEKEGTAYPIFFIVQSGATLRDARNLNVGSKPWGPIDYARVYALEGDVNYKTYLEFASRFPMVTHKIIARALGGSEAAIKDFNTGLFQVKDEKKADTFLRALLEVETVVPTGPSQPLAFAFARVFNHPQYDHGRMLEQLQDHKIEIISVPRTQSYLAMAFNTVYNIGRKDKQDLLILE